MIVNGADRAEHTRARAHTHTHTRVVGERKSISSKGNSIYSRHKGWEDRESINSQEDRDELRPGMGARVEPER